MLSLAVADLLVGILVVPFSIIIVVSSYFRLQYILCRIRSSFDMILCNSSIWNLCCISVDRYFAVCQPLRYRTKINGRVVGIMILVSWTIATLNTAIQTLQALSKAPNSKKCVLFQPKTQSTMVLGGLFAFGIPAVIMSTIYLKIFMVARKQARSILSMAKSGETVSKMEKKATKTLSIVMGIFLLSWTPFVVCITFHRLSNYPIPVHVIQSLKWLGWSNSMLNPFIYAFFYSWFRSAFKMIITGKIFKDDFSNSNLF
ncbi:trace amine-associated receptor 1-like [Solea senegalensis]|uniref:Trace amine-associated receptor 1-like n=2 Tax=Solea senegalensis TaxID=28829 RepID=A0AAV6S0M9_SOLSE|nr:trace amine-associated receptor 1-like [Solea senegalensis]